jgi:hypothetical protein
MCDTCQDCDNLTLPTGAAGATGATGATGPAGANGSNGTTILHNDLTPGTTSSGTYALFSNDKVFSVPSGTLATNGDKLEVTVMFTLSNTIAAKQSGGFYQILIGGTDIAGALNSVPYGGIDYLWSPAVTGVNAQFRVKLDISRISATSLMVHSDSYWTDPDGIEKNHYHFSNIALTVADVTANALAIQIKGKVYDISSDVFACNQLNVNNLIQ